MGLAAFIAHLKVRASGEIRNEGRGGRGGAGGDSPPLWQHPNDRYGTYRGSQAPAGGAEWRAPVTGA